MPYKTALVAPDLVMVPIVVALSDKKNLTYLPSVASDAGDILNPSFVPEFHPRR